MLIVNFPPMYIKVCGMRDAQNIRDVEALEVDIIGFIFWPESKRYVSTKPDYLPIEAERAGVFVNASPDEIVQNATPWRRGYRLRHKPTETPGIIRPQNATHRSCHPGGIAQQGAQGDDVGWFCRWAPLRSTHYGIWWFGCVVRLESALQLSRHHAILHHRRYWTSVA